MDVRARGSLMWKEARVPGENPSVQAGDHHTLSHTTSVDHGDRTRVAVVRSESIFHCATWTIMIKILFSLRKRLHQLYHTIFF